MSAPVRAASASASRDSRVLAEVVEEITNRLQAGEAVDVEAYAAKHPAYAEELRKLGPALQALAAWSGGELGVAEHQHPSGELGDYRIQREVGRGGMGVVYEAVQVSLRRRVALKVLPFAATMDPKLLQRFHNEARAAACLHHPHIVPVHAVGCERGVHFYAMQFIDGRTVADWIGELRLTEVGGAGPAADTVTAHWTTGAAGQRSQFQAVARLGVQAAEALQHAHEQGVIHRDVKPANLIVDARGKLWVTDFGLAQVQSDVGLTATGDVVGTLRYASPEQALGKRELIDHRTDVYSLGATLYEMLALRPAVDGMDREEILRRIAFEEPRAPRLDRATVPPDLETIMLKAMAKSPSDRYATARDLADDLRRYLERRPILARRPSWRQHASKWAGRHQAFVLTAVATLALAAAALAVSTWQIARARAEAIDQRDVAEGHARAAEERERQLWLTAYPAQVGEAHKAWKGGHLSQARAALRRCLPSQGQEDARGFEWYFLWDRCRAGAEPRLLPGHVGRVYGVAYSPDGRTLASGGQDRTVRLWDVATGAGLAVLTGHEGEVGRVKFSPDGRMLASSSDDRTVRLWDVKERVLKAVLRHPMHPVIGGYFRPDGAYLAYVVDGGRVELWDPGTNWRLPLEGRMPSIWCGATSPGGRFLALGEEVESAHVWDLETGRRILSYKVPTRAWQVVFCNDRELLVAHADGVRLQRACHGSQQEFDFPAEGHVLSVACSGDGRLLAAAGLHEWGMALVRVWDLQSRMRREVAIPPTWRVWSMAFSPGSEVLACAGENGTLSLHPLGPREAVPRLQGDVYRTGDLAWSEDGEHLATREDRPDGSFVVKAWNPKSGLRVGLPSESRHPVRLGHPLLLSRDRPTVVFSTKEEHTWAIDSRTGTRLLGERWTKGYALAPGGRSLVFCDCHYHGPVSLDLATGQERRFELRPQAGPIAVAVSPDEKLVACGYSDGVVNFWDAASGRRVPGALQGPSKGVVQMLFSHDGSTLATLSAAEGMIDLWEVGAGRRMATAASWGGAQARLAFSRDGKTLAVAGPRRVTLYHVATGQEFFALDDHHTCTPTAFFTPDGQSLYTGGFRSYAAGAEGYELIRWYAPR